MSEDVWATICAQEKEEGVSAGVVVGEARVFCFYFGGEGGFKGGWGGGSGVSCMGEPVCCRVNGELIVPATF